MWKIFLNGRGVIKGFPFNQIMLRLHVSRNSKHNNNFITINFNNLKKNH